MKDTQLRDTAVPLSDYKTVPPYITKDGSVIRELMHPAVHGNHNQSLAEAKVEPGATTALHLHHHSEELYHVIAGEGVMTLGDEEFRIGHGATVCIPPNTPHQLHNDGDVTLTVLCCCAPPYSHEDTELL